MLIKNIFRGVAKSTPFSSAPLAWISEQEQKERDPLTGLKQKSFVLRRKKAAFAEQYKKEATAREFAKIFKQTANNPENFIAGFTKEELEGTNDQIKRALSLNNASPTGILKFRIAQAVKKFGKNPNDTGSAAVQVAVLSERIIHLTSHLESNRQDMKTKRYLQYLLEYRSTMLNYLRRTEFHYYKWVTAEYKLPQDPPAHGHHKDGLFNVYPNRGLMSNKARKDYIKSLNI